MSNDTEKVYTDRIIERGKGSLALKIPAMLAKRFGLKEGDTAEYFSDGGELVIIFPKGKAEKTGDVPENGVF